MSNARYPSLHDRVVFITGGGSGIGAAMVEAFVAQGSSVAFVDVARDESLRLVEIRQRLGPIAVLVNNAANDTRRAFAEVTEADWDFTIAVNLKHQFFAAQIAAQSMREIGGGSIINFSSTAWMIGSRRLTVYAAAKAAVLGLTNSLAHELGGDNIRVNCIAPGAIMTERQRRLWFTTEADVAAMVARQCLPQAIGPEAVASAALFLAADDSRMITKHCLLVDAGLR